MDHFTNAFVSVFAKRVEVEPQTAFKHGRILRNDGQLPAQVIHFHAVNRLAVQKHGAVARLNEPEESDKKSALSTPCAANYADFGAMG